MSKITIQDLKSGNFLFKYRDWNDKDGFHRKTIEKKELYLPSPIDFPDKLDCRIPEKITNAENTFVNSFASLCDLLGITGYEKWTMAYSLFQKNKPKLVEFEESFQEKNWIPFIKDRIGVLSLATRPDSDFLWKNNASGHSGFCLVLDKRPFVQPLMQPYLFYMVGLVEYHHILPNINLSDWSMAEQKNRFFTKSIVYEEECEYRCVRLLWNKSLTRFLSTADCLKAVIIGKNMPTTAEQELRKAVKEHWDELEILREE